MKRAALYVRVSTQEQKSHGLSVDNQIDALKAYCEANRLKVYRVYNDAGISGHASYKKRPELLRLIEDCKAGNIDVILFTRIDRWFRSIKDYYLVMEQIGGVPWRAIWEDYNTETSDGQFKVNIMLSISEAEASRTSEKIKSVMDYKRKKGHFIGHAPLGYKRKDMVLVKDPETAHLVELMFRTYFETGSTKKAMKALNDAGYRTCANAVRLRIENEAYCDERWAPYITREQHDQIMEDMKKYVREPVKTRHDYIFSGLLICKYCGCRMHAKSHVNYRKDGTPVPGFLYGCNGRERAVKHDISFSISEFKLEAQLLDVIEPIMEEYNKAVISAVGNNEDLSKEISRLKTRLDRIGIRFEDGDISVEEYKSKRADIIGQIRELEARGKDQAPIELPEGWKEMYHQLSNAGRKAFWRSFIDEIVLDCDTRYAITAECVRFKRVPDSFEQK